MSSIRKIKVSGERYLWCSCLERFSVGSAVAVVGNTPRWRENIITIREHACQHVLLLSKEKEWQILVGHLLKHTSILTYYSRE